MQPPAGSRFSLPGTSTNAITPAATFSNNTGPPAQSLLDVREQCFGQVAKHLLQHPDQFAVIKPGRENVPQLAGHVRMGAEVVVKPNFRQLDETGLGNGPDGGRTLVAGGRAHFAHDIAGDQGGQYARVIGCAGLVHRSLYDFQAAGGHKLESAASSSIEQQACIFAKNNGFQFGSQTIRA